MSSLVISGDTSGAVSLTAAAVAGSNTITVQAATGTMSVNTLATAVASTSGTSIDFTSIPSWVKRITVMFAGVSTSGTSQPIVQIGSGSVQTTGYLSGSATVAGANQTGLASSTAGFVVFISNATATISGHMTITVLGSNIYVSSHAVKQLSTNISTGGGDVTLSGTLDRIRITTTNGTDTFDAGSVNILYEG